MTPVANVQPMCCAAISFALRGVTQVRVQRIPCTLWRNSKAIEISVRSRDYPLNGLLRCNKWLLQPKFSHRWMYHIMANQFMKTDLFKVQRAHRTCLYMKLRGYLNMMILQRSGLLFTYIGFIQFVSVFRRTCRDFIRFRVWWNFNNCFWRWFHRPWNCVFVYVVFLEKARSFITRCFHWNNRHLPYR